MVRKFKQKIALFGSFSADALVLAQRHGEAAAKDEKATLHQLQVISKQFNQIELLARLAFAAIVEQRNFGSPDFKPSIFPFELELFHVPRQHLWPRFGVVI
jgi:hypothetical protein